MANGSSSNTTLLLRPCNRIPIRTTPRSAEHSPVRYVDTLNAYVVSRHADVRRVMRDHQSFSSEAMAALVSRPAEYAADADLVEDAGDYPLSLVGLDGDAIIPAFARS